MRTELQYVESELTSTRKELEYALEELQKMEEKYYSLQDLFSDVMYEIRHCTEGAERDAREIE